MTPIRRLLYYFGRYKRSLLTGFLCGVGSAAVSLAMPSIVGRAGVVLSSAARWCGTD